MEEVKISLRLCFVLFAGRNAQSTVFRCASEYSEIDEHEFSMILFFQRIAATTRPASNSDAQILASGPFVHRRLLAEPQTIERIVVVRMGSLETRFTPANSRRHCAFRKK